MIKEAQNIVDLISEADPLTLNIIEDKLVKDIPNSLFLLESACLLSNSTNILNKLSSIILSVKNNSLEQYFKHNYLVQNNNEVLKPVIKLTKFEFGDVFVEELHEFIINFTQSFEAINKGLNSNLQKIKLFNELFYHHYNFKIVPGLRLSHNFINYAVVSQKGSSVCISILYYILCKKLHIPLNCIYSPFSFIYSCHDNGNEFYINPIIGGEILDKIELLELYHTYDFMLNDASLKVMSPTFIILRYLRDLILFYEKQNIEAKANTLNNIYVYFKNVFKEF